MQNKLQRELSTEISLAKCYRAKRRAESIITYVKEQYRRIRDYVLTIMKTNPESLVKV